MKNLISFIFCGISFCTFAQMNVAMPPGARDFYDHAMGSIKPAIKNLVVKQAYTLKHKNINPDSLIHELKKNPLVAGISTHGLEAITLLIIIQASKDADDDLKDLVIKMGKSNGAGNPDHYNETGAILEQKSRMAETIGLAMEKIASYHENVINNLR